MFPFHQLENKKILNLITQTNQIAINYNKKCSICEKTVNQTVNSIHCKNCRTYIHKKCSNPTQYEYNNFAENHKYWDCIKCCENKFPFSNLTNEEIISLGYETNHTTKYQRYSHQNDLNVKMNKLRILESDPEKFDFYSDIDTNISLDMDFKYYDQTDFNNLTKTIDSIKSFSLLHTNISSLNGNGEKLETLINSIDIKFDIIAVTETWNCEKNNHMFSAIEIKNYNEYEGQMGSSQNGGCGLFINSKLNYIPRQDFDQRIKNGNSETEMKWI